MYDGTIITTDPALIEEIEGEHVPEGFRAYLLADTDPGDSPRDWCNVATIINTNDRLIDIDEDVAGLREAREHFRDEELMKRYVAMFRPDVLLWVDHWDAGRENYGWGYVTRESWVEGFGEDYAGDVTPQQVFDSEVEVYRQWAEGEVYGVIVVNEETGQEASLWSVYDDGNDYATVGVVKDLLSELGYEESTCRHCGRRIVKDAEEGWIDPEAGYDDEDGDGVWRVTCDAHDTFVAEHEPQEG